jgi:hypothetical protein
LPSSVTRADPSAYFQTQLHLCRHIQHIVTRDDADNAAVLFDEHGGIGA